MTYLSLRSVQLNCTSKGVNQQTNTLLFQYSIGRFCCCRQFVSVIKALSCNIQYPLYRPEWHTAQQHTQGALLCFHCYNGQAHAPQYYFTIQCAYAITWVPKHTSVLYVLCTLYHKGHMFENTGLFEIIVGVLTTCHTQYT